MALSRRCGIIVSKPSDSATAEARGIERKKNISEYCFSSIFPYSNIVFAIKLRAILPLLARFTIIAVKNVKNIADNKP